MDKVESERTKRTYETSLASLEVATLQQREEVRRLYGWFMGRVLRNEKPIRFRTKDNAEITIVSLAIPFDKKAPVEQKILSRLVDGHAVYISRDCPIKGLSHSIDHYAFLLSSDGSIRVARDISHREEEYKRFIKGKSLDLIEEDLSRFKPANVERTVMLAGVIRDEILPEVLTAPKK